MYCKNLRIRTKKYVKYLYCKLENKEVTIQSCNECDKKSYIKKGKIKGKKHKQTIETEIDKFVK